MGIVEKLRGNTRPGIVERINAFDRTRTPITDQTTRTEASEFARQQRDLRQQQEEKRRLAQQREQQFKPVVESGLQPVLRRAEQIQQGGYLLPPLFRCFIK